jgi:hypothetical protein
VPPHTRFHLGAVPHDMFEFCAFPVCVHRGSLFGSDRLLQRGRPCSSDPQGQGGPDPRFSKAPAKQEGYLRIGECHPLVQCYTPSGSACCQAVVMIQPVLACCKKSTNARAGCAQRSNHDSWSDLLGAAVQDYDYGTMSLPDSADSHTSIRAGLDNDQGR